MIAAELPPLDPAQDPLEIFADWFSAAERAGLPLPEAMSVSTATPDGAPASRMVLLKAFDARGFVFHTNYESRKGRELDANPRAALLFHWATLERQVRIEGSVERLPAGESDAYFGTRDRASRVGAWASKQSRPLAERSELELAIAETLRRFEGADVPRPEFWGGYRVVPSAIEFWQGRPSRLHDRVVFTREPGEPAGPWNARRLYP